MPVPTAVAARRSRASRQDAARPHQQFVVRRAATARCRAAVRAAGQVQRAAARRRSTRTSRRADARPILGSVRALLERVVRAAGRRPGRVLLVVALVAGSRPCWRCGWSRARRRDAGRQGLGRLPGDRGLPRALRRRRDRRARARRPRQPRADRQPRPAARARGLPVGQHAEGRGGAGRRRSRRARSSRAPSRSRSSTGRARSSTRRSARSTTQLAGAARQRAAQAGARERGGAQARARRRAARRREQDKAASAAEQLVYAQFARDLLAAQPAVRARPQGAAAAQRPRLRLRARVRPVARRDDAEGALRLPVPDRKVGADPGAAEAGPERRQRRRAIELVRERGGDAGVEAQRRRELHGHRRAGRGRGPRGGADRLDAAAAGGRARS